MFVPWVQKIGRKCFRQFTWYQRLGYRWQEPTPPQAMAHAPFVLRLRPPAARPNANSRQPPYILRGRSEVMTELAARLFSAEGSLSVVEGTPGIGKTSLLETIGRYAENQGFAWVRLNRWNLCHLASFHDAMLRSDPAQGSPGRLLSFGLGTPLRSPFWNVAETSASRNPAPDALAHSTYATIRLALRKRAYARGLLVTVDDGKGVWHDHHTHSAERTIVSAVLNTFNSRLCTPRSKLPVTAIVAGITGTINEVQQAVSQQLTDRQVVMLGRIPNDSVDASIMDWLRVSDPNTGLTPVVFPSEFICECVNRCEGHPLHTAAVGHQLQTIGLHLAEQGREKATAADVDQARRAIAERMLASYRTRYHNVGPRDAEVMKDIARAVTQWGPRIGYSSMANLIEESGRRAASRIPATTNESEHSSWLERLREQGLIAAYQTTPRYAGLRGTDAGPAHVDIDLPSFATYIVQQSVGARGTFSQEELESIIPVQERNIPAWSWPTFDNWNPIEELAVPPPDNPYALHPLVPGDQPDISPM